MHVITSNVVCVRTCFVCENDLKRLRGYYFMFDKSIFVFSFVYVSRLFA